MIAEFFFFTPVMGIFPFILALGQEFPSLVHCFGLKTWDSAGREVGLNAFANMLDFVAAGVGADFVFVGLVRESIDKFLDGLGGHGTGSEL